MKRNVKFFLIEIGSVEIPSNQSNVKFRPQVWSWNFERNRQISAKISFKCQLLLEIWRFRSNSGCKSEVLQRFQLSNLQPEFDVRLVGIELNRFWRKKLGFGFFFFYHRAKNDSCQKKIRKNFVEQLFSEMNRNETKSSMSCDEDQLIVNRSNWCRHLHLSFVSSIWLNILIYGTPRLDSVSEFFFVAPMKIFFARKTFKFKDKLLSQAKALD